MMSQKSLEGLKSVSTAAAVVLRASTSKPILEPKTEDHRLHPSDLDDKLGSENYLSFRYNLAAFGGDQGALERWTSNPCRSPVSFPGAGCREWAVMRPVTVAETAAARWQVWPECMLALPANSLPVMNIDMN